MIKQYVQARQMMKQMMGAKGKMRFPFKGMR